MKIIFYVFLISILSYKTTFAQEFNNREFQERDSLLNQKFDDRHFSNTTDKDDSKYNSQLVRRLQESEINKTRIFNYKLETDIELTTQMKDYLNSIALYLIEHPKTSVVIFGNTANRGTPEELLKLSENKANNASKYLISKSIKKDRIKTIANGPEKPLVDNNSEEGRRKNSRIEIIIKP